MAQVVWPGPALTTWWFFLLGGGQPLGTTQLLTWTTASTLLLAIALLVAVPAFTRARCVTAHAVHTATLRRRAHRTAVVPQRDPAARGRTRPRAPTSGRRVGGCLAPFAGLLALSA